MAPAPWDGLPVEDTLFVLVTGGNRFVSLVPSPEKTTVDRL